MNRKFFRSLAVMITALLFMSVSSYAQDIMDQLGLSARQKEQITELREQFKRQSKPIVDEIRRLLDEEKRLRKAGAGDADLRRAMKLRADKEIELSLALTRFNEKLESILTPDQRKLLQKIISDRNNGKRPN